MQSKRALLSLFCARIGHLLLPLHRRVKGHFNGADPKPTESASSSLLLIG
jgi:hypothetical protein